MIHTHTHTHIYIYIYIYTHNESNKQHAWLYIFTRTLSHKYIFFCFVIIKWGPWVLLRYSLYIPVHVYDWHFSISAITSVKHSSSKCNAVKPAMEDHPITSKKVLFICRSKRSSSFAGSVSWQVYFNPFTIRALLCDIVKFYA